jgi:hypothetical protein
MPPVAFGLGMHLGIAIDLAGRSLQDLDLEPFGEPQPIDGPLYAGLGSLHRVELIVDRRGGAGEVIDLIDLHIEREGDKVSKSIPYFSSNCFTSCWNSEYLDRVERKIMSSAASSVSRSPSSVVVAH